MKRWVAIATAIVILILLVAFVGVWTRPGRSSAAELENWIGRQIVAVLQGYVRPQIAFREVHYQPPRTVLISGFSLTADEQPILSVDRAVLQLAEVPRRGKPIQVRRVELQRPKLWLVAQTGGGLLGWSSFLQPGVLRHPESVPAGRRLSDILVLRHAEIHEGEITYADAQAGSEPMTLPGIELTLDTPPEAGEPGWYRLIGTLQRAPMFQAQLNGRINLDTALLELARLELALTLDEGQYGTLPPRLQKLLRTHQVRGELAAEAQGQIPLREPGQAQLQMRARLENGRFAYGGATFPVGSIETEGQLPAGPIHIGASKLALHAGGQEIASIEEVTGRLTRLPPPGEPLPIERIDIQSPRLAFWRDGRGGFVGWRELGTEAARPGPRLAADTGEQAGNTAAVAQAVAERVSLGALQVHNAAIFYETSAGQSLLLDAIDVALHSSRTPKNPGIWQVRGTLSRAPFLTSEVAARLDPRSLELDLDRFDLRADLTDSAYESLPPQTRASLPAAQLLGELDASASAHIPLRAPSDSAGQMQFDVRDGRLIYHNTTWRFTHLTAAGHWPGGPFSLAADDVELHSGSDSVLSIVHVAAEMPRSPAPGQPLDVSQLVLQSPRVELKQATGGGFVGWNEVLRGGHERNTPQASASAPGGQAGARWRVRSLEAHDGQLRLILLDSPDQMAVLGIELQAQPAATPEWYSFTGAVRHAPDLESTFSGAFNPEQSLVDLSALDIQAVLADQQYSSWPPQLQAVLRKYQVRGTLQAQAAGRFSWRDSSQAEVQLSAQLQNGQFALGSTVWQVPSLQVQSRIAAGQAAADYTGSLFGGEVRGHAGLTLAPPRVFSADWNAVGLDMTQVLRAADGGKPRYVGRIASTGAVTGQLASLPASLSGSGTLHITEARLVELPIIRELLAPLTRTQLGSRLTRLDQAEATFSVQPDHVFVSEGEVTTVLASLQGRGRIYYDKRLDLEVKVTPLSELQRLTGPIGETLGKLTAQVVTYKVHGTLEHPKIQVAPLGL